MTIEIHTYTASITHKNPLTKIDSGRVFVSVHFQQLIVPTLQRGNAAWTLQRPQFTEKSHGRTRYVIQEPDKPHFRTCTVVE